MTRTDLSRDFRSGPDSTHRNAGHDLAPSLHEYAGYDAENPTDLWHSHILATEVPTISGQPTPADTSFLICPQKLSHSSSPLTGLSEVSDPEEIKTLLALWKHAEKPTGQCVVQRLHVMVDSTDYSLVIVGFSNLSASSFYHNIELLFELSGEAARNAVRALHKACVPHSSEIFLDQLRGID